LTQPAMLLGTPGYMAPEQVLGLEVDFRTDLFSFGVVVYEMLSGSNPYEAATVTATLAQILEHEPDSLSTVCPGCPLELSQIVTRCLSKDRTHRYDSTYELAGDLERLQARVPVVRARAEAGRAAATTGVSRGAQSLTPLWWWEFHQAVVSAVYIFTIYPAWLAREWLRPPWGNLLLLAILVCATIATSLRLHLWFTARFCPAELTPLRAKAFPWTRWSDAGFATALLLTGLGIDNAHPEVATLLITISIGAAVASFVIEPTTTRAAFCGRSGAIRTPHKPRR
ncbi:MAG: serine/threonine protein kinase, partial [Vicinamibacterales bacterium]